MPKFKPPFITSFQTSTAEDAADTFDFVSSIGDQPDEESVFQSSNSPSDGSKPTSEKTDPIEEFVDTLEESEENNSAAAVLDFALTGNEDWGTKAVDDFLF